MPSAAREGNHSGSACAVNEITGNNADTLHCEKKKKDNEGNTGDVRIIFTREEINSRMFSRSRTITLRDDSRSAAGWQCP